MRKNELYQSNIICDAFMYLQEKAVAYLFVDLLMFRFGVFGGMCDVNSCNVFLLLFVALWVPISATLFRRALLTRLHAFPFLGLRFFPLFFFLLGGLHCFFL
jgi:hypothetical protein